MVRILPACPEDMPFIAKEVKRLGLDVEGLENHQFLVAKEGERIVGFGRMKHYGEIYEMASLGVMEDFRGRGIGRMLVEALLDHFPSKEVYLVTDIPSFFEKFGFKVTCDVPPPIADKIKYFCAGTVAMVLRK